MYWMASQTYRIINDERIRALHEEAQRNRLARDAVAGLPRRRSRALGRVGNILRVPNIFAPAPDRGSAARKAASNDACCD